MKAYPIWNLIESCIYKTGKSYGARDTSDCTVLVGTSARNSVELVTHTTTRRTQGDYTVFTFGVDANDGRGLQIIARKWMHTKKREWFDTEPADIEVTKAA